MSDNSFGKKELRECYERYFEAIRNYIYFKVKDEALAEDIVQETFIKLWQKRDTIRIETVKSLLYVTANNTVINHFNHLKVVRNHEAEVVHQQKGRSSETPDYVLEGKEFQVKLDHVIESIPEGSKVVFLMNRIDGLKYHEIADRLNIGVKAVEKRMGKAIAIVKEHLGRKI